MFALGAVPGHRHKMVLYLRDQMDYDDRRRLAQIVTETCAAISRRLKVCFVLSSSLLNELSSSQSVVIGSADIFASL